MSNFCLIENVHTGILGRLGSGLNFADKGVKLNAFSFHALKLLSTVSNYSLCLLCQMHLGTSDMSSGSVRRVSREDIQLVS